MQYAVVTVKLWRLSCPKITDVDWSYRVPVELTSEQISDARLPRAYYDAFQTAMRLSNTVSSTVSNAMLAVPTRWTRGILK